MPATTPDDVLAYWLGPPATTTAAVFAKERQWFGGGPERDAEIIARFGPAVEATLRGELDAWAATPRGRVALVVVLDQLTRHVLRGDPRMYAGDATAQRLALEAFAGGMDASLGFEERLFLSMPLLHAEDLRVHDRLRDIAARIAVDAPAVYAPLLRMWSEQLAKYRGVIACFGRFPHRNALLGRITSAVEDEFLRDWALLAPPRGSSGAASRDA